MGKYYDESVFEQGRPIAVSNRKPVTPPAIGQRLVMKLDRTTRVIYPDVTDPDEFDLFYQQYAEGWWLTYEVRLIDTR